MSEGENTTESNSVEVKDFDKVIAESKAQIAEQAENKPKKRGRPKKQVEVAQETSAVNPASESQQVSFDPQVLKPVIQLPFEAVAAARNCESWKLPDAQAEALAPLVDECMKRYLPKMGGEHQALTGVVLILGTHVVTAYMIEVRTRQQIQQENEKHLDAVRVQKPADPVELDSWGIPIVRPA